MPVRGNTGGAYLRALTVLITFESTLLNPTKCGTGSALAVSGGKFACRFNIKGLDNEIEFVYNSDDKELPSLQGSELDLVAITFTVCSIPGKAPVGASAVNSGCTGGWKIGITH